MDIQKIQLVIPLAGEGKRFKEKYNTPKPLIDVLGQKMISISYKTLKIPHNKVVFIIRKDHNEDNQLVNELNKLNKNCSMVEIDSITEGPCCTALLAKTFLNSEDPLVIANCDQVMSWDGAKFIRYCNTENYDGALVTYHASTEKNSYAQLNAIGNVIQVKEKKLISNVSLNGIHFWKKAKYFFESAQEMIDANDRTNNEFYIAPSYNYLLRKNYTVGIYHIPNEQHNPIGTIEDLETFISKQK
jgi:choline kinase